MIICSHCQQDRHELCDGGAWDGRGEPTVCACYVWDHRPDQTDYEPHDDYPDAWRMGQDRYEAEVWRDNR